VRLRREGVLAGLCVLALCLVPHAFADGVPPHFEESAVISNLVNPTQVRFSPDGRVFVAEKSGVILVYQSLGDQSPTAFADLSTQVDDYWDRGLLSIALDPDFPVKPYVYALFTYDAPIGGTAPVWNDVCPTPPNPTIDGCVVSGRLVRLTAVGDHADSEQVLLEGWCQQYPSHSVGDLAFGPDGALYVSGGEGANFFGVDYGQYGGYYSGDPVNPCGDPASEGGALRSQSLLRAAGQPVLLNGAILRLDPSTGAGLPDNPLASSADANARRIVASGLRNPFRFTVRPGTGELWVGDVGWNDWEEVDRVQSATTAPVANFGWPCYEGAGRQAGYESAALPICDALYGSGAARSPYFAYAHAADLGTGAAGSSSISGLAFYDGSAFPSSYDGALFFADYSRRCIWAMLPGSGGLPDPANVQAFVNPAAAPVDVEVGPDGNLYYVDLDGGTIDRIRYFAGDLIPTAAATATPTSGSSPLTVQFDGTGSSDPDAGDSLTYHWDFGDGQSDDSVAPSHTYDTPGIYAARLTVTDQHGAMNTSAPITVSVDASSPVPKILTPSASTTWKVGDAISFSGQADDAQDGRLPASALTWTLIVHHCPSTCHTHIVQTFPGAASGSLVAPDHDYPSYLELQLKATDSDGHSATTSVSLQPKTAVLALDSSPRGLRLVVGSTSSTTPFTRTVILGSRNTISAPRSQALGPHGLGFAGWSDGKSATHDVVASAPQASYTAFYRDVVSPSAAVSWPATGVRIGGRIAVQVAASDDTGVAGVQVKLDGKPLGPELKHPPYTLRWRTGLTGVGHHTLTATARDAAGNTATSAPVRVTVFSTSKHPSWLLRGVYRPRPRLLRLPRWLFVRWH
jgi:glucose/arabinose dehydrogenase/PKD repeat protein